MSTKNANRISDEMITKPKTSCMIGDSAIHTLDNDVIGARQRVSMRRKNTRDQEIVALLNRHAAPENAMVISRSNRALHHKAIGQQCERIPTR